MNNDLFEKSRLARHGGIFPTGPARGPAIRRVHLLALMMAVAFLAGCSSDKMQGLTSTPPVPYLLVPHRFFLSAFAGTEGNDVASREDLPRRMPMAAVTGAGRGKNACFDAGAAAAQDAAMNEVINDQPMTGPHGH